MHKRDQSHDSANRSPRNGLAHMHNGICQCGINSPPLSWEGTASLWKVDHSAGLRLGLYSKIQHGAANRIVNGNTDAQGSLDNDNAARAILQYRNTPIQGIGLSPAQQLLRDSIPSQPFLYKPHPEWIAAAKRHEEILRKRNAKMVETYNRYTHNLCPLQAGDTVDHSKPT